jgi:hypothetical protein
MPQATSIVINFDDGSTYEVDAASVGSLFLREDAAVQCGHKPPYGKPPSGGDTVDSSVDSTTATSEESTVDSAFTTEDAGTCYLINGVIICP